MQCVGEEEVRLRSNSNKATPKGHSFLARVGKIYSEREEEREREEGRRGDRVEERGERARERGGTVWMSFPRTCINYIHLRKPELVPVSNEVT